MIMGSKECDIDRQSKLDLILNSTSEYKVIVAGAGTGKTYTFKKLLEKMVVYLIV